MKRQKQSPPAKSAANLSRWGRRTAWTVLLASLVASSSPALAVGKKKVEEAPTQSYTMPYLIVITLVGMGLMGICRPSRRADRPEEKKKDD